MWWRQRNWRTDLAVLARVRSALKASNAFSNEQDTAVPAAHEAAATQSPVPAGLNDPAIASIRETFAIVAAAGDEAIGYFYGWMFSRYPGLRDMFPPAMDQQRDRLFRALARIVDGLGAPEDLAEYLTQLGRDHRKYRVEPAMYEALGQALIATLRTYAGPAFTATAEDAWTQVYQAASSLMIRAAEDSSTTPAYWTAEVVANEQRRPGIAVLTVAPDQPYTYQPGQHVTVQTPLWPRVWRPYSVACRPREDGLLSFHVRAVPGGWVSNALVYRAFPGDELVLGPPLGTMTLASAGQRDLLCVAGGTGLSPVKAIIEQAVRDSATCPRQVFLFCGARTREELYDLPDLYRLSDAYPRLLITPVTSDDPAFNGMQGNVGRVAARYLPHRDCEAYVAGPPAMVRETVRALTRAGIPTDRIRFDDALVTDDGFTASAGDRPVLQAVVPQLATPQGGAPQAATPQWAASQGVASQAAVLHTAAVQTAAPPAADPHDPQERPAPGPEVAAESTGDWHAAERGQHEPPDGPPAPDRHQAVSVAASRRDDDALPAGTVASGR